MNNDIEIDPAEAERLKAEGQALVLQNSIDFRDAVRQIICDFARTGREFTSTDVRQVARSRGVSPPSHPNAWGAAFCSAAKLRWIRATGAYVKSPIPTCHAAVVAVWVGDGQ